MKYAVIESPVGDIVALSDGASLHALLFSDSNPEDCLKMRGYTDFQEGTDEVILCLSLQLSEYFAGSRKEFDLPLKLETTSFRKKSWNALLTIPYGETRSYGEQAKSMKRPKAARAVGQANNKNPISIVIPCHRVVSANGHLTGYEWGMDKKKWLLDHEKSHS